MCPDAAVQLISDTVNSPVLIFLYILLIPKGSELTHWDVTLFDWSIKARNKWRQKLRNI